AAVAGDPLEEAGGFQESYVNQEKDQLAKEIKSIINDKALYALEKCVEIMCAGEPFGVFKLGRVEDLAALDRVSLMRYYRHLFTRNPLELYVVGDLAAEQVLEAARETLFFERQPAVATFPAVEIYREPGAVKFQEEAMDVSQSKLAMGYRTNTSYDDPLYFALLMYNGILGAFPHSKLFMNVREKAGLAYYVYSRLEKHKGIMIVAAGIESGDYEQAKDIIEEQMADMAAGKISEPEMENTRRGLINQLRAQDDNPYQMISFYLDGAIGGKQYTIPELIRGLESVGPAEIKAAAGKVRLDTIYLLRGRQGGEAA
ncbi:MAG: pitrilysin family protein, partial [Bacillota bacterium]